MAKLHYFLFLITAMSLSACASSDVSGINVAGQDRIQSVKVTEVHVALETAKPNPSLQAALTDELRKSMSQCTTGDEAHEMKVTVTDFEEQNIAQAILIGDEIELEGRVELIDSNTRTQTGAYYVANSFFWGGFIGAAVMSDAEKSLSQEFAKTICEEMFGVDLETASNDAGRRVRSGTKSGHQPSVSPEAPGATAQVRGGAGRNDLELESEPNTITEEKNACTTRLKNPDPSDRRRYGDKYTWCGQ